MGEYRGQPASGALTERIAQHVEVLCGLKPDRSPGSSGNGAAVTYIEQVLAGLGLATESLPFTTYGWHAGAASLETDGGALDAHPGPYSPAFRGSGRLVAARSLEEIARAKVADAIVLLHGPIAARQLTPRDYPWYSNPAHDDILDALEAARPACVIAATGSDPDAAAGLAPFPLIEDASFDVPSAYLSEACVPQLLASVGTDVTVLIESERFIAECAQPLGRLAGWPGAPRVLVTSHLDTKHDTPGALDNASGVAVMLGVAELLGQRGCTLNVDFVPFNGEDHFASPGEVAYLEAYPDLSDVRLVINVDGAGFAGGPTAVSRFETDAAVDTAVDAALAARARVVDGEPWFSGDHAVFVMRGIAALALTSHDMTSLWAEIPHTPADTPDRLDFELLAESACFVADVVRSLAPGHDR